MSPKLWEVKRCEG